MPRSGWAITSIVGISPSSITRAVVSRLPVAAQPVDDEARRARRTSSTLPSSDGWKVKSGVSIQRLDPRVAVASAKTSTIEPIRKP